MEEAKTDILCIQEPKIRSKSCFYFKDYVCITSTDIKGGETPPQKITKTTISPDEPGLKISLEESQPHEEHHTQSQE